MSWLADRTARHCWLSLLCWGVKLGTLSKSSTEQNPDSASTWKCFFESWTRPYSAPEMIVTDQCWEFKGSFEAGAEKLGIFQHVTDTEAPWENGPTERFNQSMEKQYELAREAFEPETEEENDELVIQGCIAHNRYYDRSGYSPYQRTPGITPRLPRSLTADDSLDTREVAEGPALDFQRSHDIRVAATTAFFKQDASNRIIRSAAARPVKGFRPAIGDWAMVHRYSATTLKR